jgi:hypothetical protein
MLLFKKKFLPAIRQGEKTQTIRLWQHCRMRSGQRSYIPGAGYIDVLSVEPVRLDDLTNHDARLDGFDSAAQLRSELDTLYQAELAAGYQAYRVRFVISADQTKRSTHRRRRARDADQTPTAGAQHA